MTEASLHPGLRRLAAKCHDFQRMLSMLLFLVMSVGMIALMAMAFSGGGLLDMLLVGAIGLVMMPVVLLLSWLLRHLDRWLYRQLERADELLRERPPVAVRLTPTGLINRLGALVTLHPPADLTANGGSVYALLNPSFRWSSPPEAETAVQLYCRALRPGEALVALQPDGKALLGKVVNLASYSRQLRLWAIGSLALIAVTAGVAGTLLVADYRERDRLEAESRLATASQAWPQTPAKVVSAELRTTDIAEGKFATTGYSATVEFEYAVAGVSRRGATSRHCDRPTENRSDAEARLARYPAGASVVARYDPGDPERAVLEAGHSESCEAAMVRKSRGMMLNAAIIGLVSLLGLLVLTQYRKNRRLLPPSNGQTR